MERVLEEAEQIAAREWTRLSRIEKLKNSFSLIKPPTLRTLLENPINQVVVASSIGGVVFGAATTYFSRPPVLPSTAIINEGFAIGSFAVGFAVFTLQSIQAYLDQWGSLMEY